MVGILKYLEEFMKYLCWLTLSLTFLIGSAVLAQDKKAETDKKENVVSDSPLDQLKAEFKKISEEMQAEQQIIIKEYREAKDDEAKAAVIKKLQAMSEPFAAQAAEIGKKIAELLDKEDSPATSFEIINWLLANTSDATARSAAIEKLVKDHLANEKIVDLIPLLQRSGANEATQSALQAISERGGTDTIKGVALISLAEYLHQFKVMFGELAAENPEALKSMPEAEAEYYKKLGAISDEEIEGLLKKAAEDFGAVEIKDSTIGEIVTKKLKAIEVQKNLAVGKVAPDIQGPDIDGESFKLSDYRGKVVMLDFWGHW